MAAPMNESTMAGPEFWAAVMPVSVKIPAPIMAPIPRAISEPGPSVRFKECSAWHSANRRLRGLVANRFILRLSESGLHAAVLLTVSEVHHKPNSEPDEQPGPIGPA